MKTKTAIALIFGLVFQLSLILPGIAAVMNCAPVTASCECCDDLNSCPCADEGEPIQNPLPLAPDSGQSLKVPLAKSTGTRVAVATFPSPPASATVVAIPSTGYLPGYTGVRLSVAFCSFVM